MRSIYLTFDDGPDPDFTPRVLDVLAQAGVRATFFAIGVQARRAPDLLRRAVSEGHEIGNHTLSHRHPWWMSERSARAQVRDGAAVLSDITGRAPRLYRPPHGRARACMVDEAAQLGERTMRWTLSAIDWGPMGRAARIQRRLERVQAGDVVLLHDGRNQHNHPDETLRVLPLMLARWRERGLSAEGLIARDRG